MELPGGETEDPTPLMLSPPSGSTNTQPAHSSPAGEEKQESSSVEPVGKDYSTQWGTGKFNPSWGNYTAPPPEPWDPSPRYALVQSEPRVTDNDSHQKSALMPTITDFSKITARFYNSKVTAF